MGSGTELVVAHSKGGVCQNEFDGFAVVNTCMVAIIMHINMPII